ncbi:hypothetical protein ACLB2K_040917 [Fragaria x ananassa]
MYLETDCVPIHIEFDKVATNYEMSKRLKVTIDDRKTTSSIDDQKMKVASASSLCDFCANFADRFGFLHEKHYATQSAEHIYRLRKHNTEKLLLRRKLLLVISLDHAFLNYTSLNSLTPDEVKCLKTQADSEYVFTVLVPPEMEPVIIKFRPKLRAFLKEAREFFEIYAYANAPQSLVWKILELLDPRNEYFGRRVISREDFHSTHKGKKSLDLVLGQKSAVLVIDDGLAGWTKSSENNVIVLPRYCFFKKSGKKKRKRKSLCELKSDARAGILASYLKYLKRMHNRFFNDEVMSLMCDNLFDRNVRMLMKIEWDAVGDDRLHLWRKAIANGMRKRVEASLSFQQKKLVKQSSEVICVEEQVDDPSSLEVAEAADVGKFPVMTEASEFTCSLCGCSSYMNTPEALFLSLYHKSHEDKYFPVTD